MLRKLSFSFLFVLPTCFYVTAQEICNNGIDDDANGLIDLNDPQCTCGIGNTPTSLIPNPSFEEMTNCPFNWSQMHYAVGWLQTSAATPDYMNTCGFVASSVSASGLMPFPDGEAATGMFILSDYKEYVGSCLTSPMNSGESYNLQMDIAVLETDGLLDPCFQTPTDYSPFELTIFGSPVCGNMPYPGCSCPTAPLFAPIGFISYDPLNNWQTINITFTPVFDVHKIVIGAPCVLPPDYPISAYNICLPYMVIDNLILNTTTSFQTLIGLSGSLCNDNAILTASPVPPGGAWQWYKDGIAIIGEINPVLNISALALEGGNYTVTFTENGNCTSGSLNVPDTEPFSISVNSPTICIGDSVTLNVTGTNEVCTWSPSTGLSATSGLSVQASPATTTNYTVTGTVNGCADTTVATVTVIPAATINVNDETICPGDSIGLNANTTGATNYSWSPAIGLNTTSGSTVQASPSATTDYIITAVVDGCPAIGISTVTVIPAIDINDEIICAGDTTTLYATGSATNYSWSRLHLQQPRITL
jgi:hypothetical protein